jgi:copper(I)-binding protein
VPPSATPAPAGPATIQIPANGFVLLNTTTGRHLELVGLSAELNSGASVPMTFDFGGKQLEVAVNMAVPLTPVPRGSSVVGDENAEGETGH